MKRRHIVSIALVCAFLAVAFLYISPAVLHPRTAGESSSEAQSVSFEGNIIHVSIADTSEERERGLSGRKRLALDEGMLFIFPQNGWYAFWMKDMRFSIDILWLSESGAVVHIVESVSPATYPTRFVSESSARYVLELPAGYAEAHKIEVGDIVRL